MRSGRKNLCMLIIINIMRIIIKSIRTPNLFYFITLSLKYSGVEERNRKNSAQRIITVSCINIVKVVYNCIPREKRIVKTHNFFNSTQIIIFLLLDNLRKRNKGYKYQRDSIKLRQTLYNRTTSN